MIACTDETMASAMPGDTVSRLLIMARILKPGRLILSDYCLILRTLVNFIVRKYSALIGIFEKRGW